MRESAVKSAERIENIAQNIRLMMFAQKVSVTDMAEKLDLTRQTLSDRLGKHPERMTLEEISKIARVLNTTLDRLICGEYRLMREEDEDNGNDRIPVSRGAVRACAGGRSYR